MKKIMIFCLMAFMAASAQAQCPGNLVTNADFQAGNDGSFTSDYDYVASTGTHALWDEAKYAVGLNPNNYHYLWASFGDHTTGTGLMMICNGQDPELVGFPQQALVWGQDVVVASSTLYDFSVWIAPSYPEAYPILQVSIDGDVIGTAVAPGGTNPGDWYQFTAQWTSGVGGTVAIEIRDMLSVHTGNDFVIDDICFVSLCPEPGLEKEITTGPDVDAVDGIDVVVEVGQLVTTSYCFTISYSNPDGPNVLILDTVPAEWIVNTVAGKTITGGSSGGPQDDGNGGTINVFKAGMGKSGATKIEWRPDPAVGCGSIEVCVETRQSPGKNNVKYSPTSCGMLCLNDGAEAYEVDEFGEPLVDPGTGERLPPIMESNSLCLVAVEDLNGGGIVGDGSGDEDEDGLSDWDEVMVVGTEPCNPDTDGDGVLDGADPEPLNPDVP